MIPPKLRAGDEVRIIAPSHSLPSDFTKEMKEQAIGGLENLGLKVTFGKYVEELDEFDTTTVEKRLEDLHTAFADKNVKAIIPATGGSSISELLKHIDYKIARDNPKILCGLSDITALSYALYAKTGVVNYYGPHFVMLGSSKIVDYSFSSMKKMLFEEGVVDYQPSEFYHEAPGDHRMILNEGPWAIQSGKAEAKSIGGNFLTTNLVLGSEFMPDLDGVILYLEENYIMDFKDIQNELQSILNQPNVRIRGLLLGRFQKASGLERELLKKIVQSKQELKGVPVVGNMDFGHTAPKITLPIGGTIRMEVGDNDEVSIQVIEH